ncbi:transcription repressor OFP8-like [Mangifera indica]|uniref:transcription repressor OFP8-like n=1 Tax=Mangifera indica TaxID=29780 RepID=UPI001CF9AB97|nr:transcription repressor OFP8-like [Mangifera indica]XP_044506903.1 transcription repressor OFP8-like [Mangifera indica]
MSTNNKKSLLKSMFTANAGCGCGNMKPSDVYDPKPRPKKTLISHNIINPSSSSSSCEKNNGKSSSTLMDSEDFSSTSFSFNAETSTCTEDSEIEMDPTKPSQLPSPCPKMVDSIAVVKESKDPYQDFRQSMLLMIMEKEIYNKDDLQQLLKCFLRLNSPCHHDVIVRAFTEIWNAKNVDHSQS